MCLTICVNRCPRRLINSIKYDTITSRGKDRSRNFTNSPVTRSEQWAFFVQRRSPGSTTKWSACCDMHWQDLLQRRSLGGATTGRQRNPGERQGNGRPIQTLIPCRLMTGASSQKFPCIMRAPKSWHKRYTVNQRYVCSLWSLVCMAAAAYTVYSPRGRTGRCTSCSGDLQWLRLPVSGMPYTHSHCRT